MNHPLLSLEPRHESGPVPSMPSMLWATAWTFLLGATLAASEPCSSEWSRGQGSSGRTGGVFVQELWDPDGDGPRSPVVLVAGAPNATAGNIDAGSVSSWDPATGVWSKIADPVDGVIRAIAILPDGSIIAGGNFLTAGGVEVNNIARWDGSRWNALGLGISGIVRAVSLRPNGSVIVAGEFTRAGGVVMTNIAQWNGQAWSRVGTGGVNGPVNALKSLQDGSLVVAGRFQRADRVANTASIARWTGTEWASLGGGLAREVFAVDCTPSGAILAASDVLSIEGGVSKLNGQTWEVVASGLTRSPLGLLALNEEEFIATGEFQGYGGLTPPYGVAKWSGGNWSELEGPVRGGGLRLTALPDGGVLLGGSFYAVGSAVAESIARWNGERWRALGSGVSGYVSAIASFPDDRRVVVGCDIGLGFTGTRFMVQDGETWSRMGQDFPNGANPAIRSIVTLSNGAFVANGAFAFPGDQFLTSVIRFDGNTWNPVPGAPLEDWANLLAGDDGDFFAAGRVANPNGQLVEKVAHWRGGVWSALGTGMDAPVLSLARGPAGDLFAAGYFSAADGTSVNGIARWDGARWASLGFADASFVDSVAVLPDGRVVAAYRSADPGPFGNACEVSALENGTWSRLGGRLEGPEKLGLQVRPDGSLVAFGPMRLPDGARVKMVRWDGARWVPIAAGFDSDIICAASAPGGDLLVGGYFERVGDRVSRFFARFHDAYPLVIGRQPESATVCLNGEATLSVGLAEGTPTSTVWETRNADGVWVEVHDGELRSERGTLLGEASGATTDTLTLRLNPNLAATSSYRNYRCRVENECGVARSDAAALSICAADFNCDGFIDFFDYDDFVACFERGQCGRQGAADFNADGFEDFFDYSDFVAAFESGC